LCTWIFIQLQYTEINEKQTYRCENSECPKKYFTESYTNKGCDPDVRRQILVMAANGNGTRATAGTPGISPNTVTAVLKGRGHKYPDELPGLLVPFDIHIIYADADYAYQARVTESTVVTGKRNTQHY